MKRCFTWIVWAVLAMSLAGCVANTNRSSRGSASGETLGQQVARHEQELQRLLSQVGQVEQVLPGQAEMWSQMQTMRQDLNTVQGKVDDMHNHLGIGGGQLGERVTRLETAVRRMASNMAIDIPELDAPLETPAYPDAGSPIAVIPSGTHTDPGTQPYVPDPEAGGSAGASGTPGSVDTATALYDAGIKSFDQKKYKEAIVSFKDFAANFPKHKLAGNAHFWQGECYYQMKEYPRAILSYQEVIDNYPGSAKYQTSMFKQGVSLYYAGKKQAAKERLNDLIKRYPNSPDATRAKQFMAKNK